MRLALPPHMDGRRAHPRVVVTGATRGVMRVLRDAVVQRRNEGGWLAVSCEGATIGEVLVLDVLNVGFDEAAHSLRVRVIDSRPVMVNGAVRHGLRLEPLGEGQLAEGPVD